MSFFALWASAYLVIGDDAAAQELAHLEQQAFTAAAEAVADCVVQIRTVGGLDQLGGDVLAQGPTTGLIVSEDGYIVSSAFNFAQQPASVLVRLPDGQQRPAQIVGRDSNRMLVLLKVESPAPLPTPTATPLEDIHVGDWAVGLGRTYDAARVNVSVGVVSALNRMHGRAIQTDASASAANYGGPLVDLRGRVIGVLVPMAPQTAGADEANELAGAEFYDSGIAFAVPLAGILDNLDRWVQEKDLKRGVLGIGMEDGAPYATPPKITSVWPQSPAATAGWQPGDVIVSVEGVTVATQTQLRYQTAPRYAGDRLKVSVRRGSDGEAKEIATEIVLAAKLDAYRHAFLGILPRRDASRPASAAPSEDPDDETADARPDSGTGLTARAVWPHSPAADAGLQPGDRFTKIADKTIASLADASAALAARNPGDTIDIVVQRGDETLQKSVTLDVLPTDVLSREQLQSAAAAPQPDDAADGDAKLKTMKLAELSQSAYYYQSQSDGPAPGLLMWLGDGDAKTRDAMLAAWQADCDRDRLVLLLPEPADDKGWSSDDLEFLARILSSAITRFGVDPARVVVGGEGKAGQLAYVLGLKARQTIRGIVAVDSPLPRTLELPPSSPGTRLAVLSVETKGAPLATLIRSDLQKLEEAGYPVTQAVRTAASDAGEPLDPDARATLSRWIDALDRL